MTPERLFTALVLAGSRGTDDPVASAAGERHKALVPVDGVPMLLRVVRTLRESRLVGRIALSLEDPSLIRTIPEISDLADGGRIVLLTTDRRPSLSVLRALRTLPEPFPLLVATADHPLLTAAMVDHFCASLPADADVAVAVARASVVQQAYPNAVRTYFRLAGEGYSGCNLFALRTPASARAAEFWSEMERHRKRPWRLVSAVGPGSLVRFVLGRLTLEAALRRLSRVAGTTIRAVEMPFPEAAIDVDKPADLVLAEGILQRRL